MKSTTKRGVVRVIVTAIVLAAMTIGAVAGFNRLDGRTTTNAGVAEAEAPKTATVTRGDLTSTERVDGSVQMSTTRTVIHRIDGQARGSSSDAAASSGATGTTGGESTTGASANGGAGGLGNASGLSTTARSLTSQSSALDVEQTSVGSSVGAAITTDTTPNMAPPATGEAATPALDTTTTTTPTTTPTSTDETPISAPGSTAPDTTVPPTTPPSSAPDTSISGPSGPGGAPGGVPSGPAGGAPSSGSAAGGSSQSTAAATERLTSVSPIGTTVDAGATLYTVENKPVIALGGLLPAWRTMSTSSDDGADIRQLEQSLADLGYDPDATMSIDETFDSDTTRVVKAWQKGVGLEVTGEVAFGSVVFLVPGTTVTDVHVSVGDSISDGDNVVTISTAEQQVVIDVSEELQRLVTVGLKVDVDGTEGTVILLRSTERDDGVVVQAIITPSAALDAASGSTISVRMSATTHSGVLLAPAAAVAARLDGSYAVRIVGTDGASRWESIAVIGVGGTNVAIEGSGVAEGDVVQVPE